MSKTYKKLVAILALICGCAMGAVSPGMTLLAGINHYQEEMEMFGMRSERWPERQRMGDLLKNTFAVALGRSQEFNRLVDLDLRRREFTIALSGSSLPAGRGKEGTWEDRPPCSRRKDRFTAARPSSCRTKARASSASRRGGNSNGSFSQLLLG